MVNFMKGVLFFGLLVFFSAACNQIQSESVGSNLTAVKPANSQAINQPSNSTIPSPTPMTKMTDEKKSVNEADYTVSKFDYAKMKAATLGTQPLEIIKEIAAFDPERLKELNPSVNIKEELKAFDKYKIKTAEYDFNHDGVAERIILSRGETGGEVELFSVFMLKGEQWHLIFSIEGDLDIPKVPPMEILTGANKTGFDLIKTIAKRGTNDDSQDVRYYQMRDDQYEAFDCYFVDGKTKESTPCG